MSTQLDILDRKYNGWTLDEIERSAPAGSVMLDLVAHIRDLKDALVHTENTAMNLAVEASKGGV